MDEQGYRERMNTTPEPRPTAQHRKRLIALLVAAFLAGVIATVAVVLTANRSPAYDEAAHRAAVEEFLGHEVGDWDDYRDIAQDVCEKDESAFSLYIAVVYDRQGLDGLALMKIDIRHMCPDRGDEFDDVVNSF